MTPHVIDPVLASLARQHPRLLLEIVVEDRLVDLVREGFDLGIRLSEAVQRDMVAVRVADPFRFVVVGSPAYLRRRGRPQRPVELRAHDGILFRTSTTGAPYRWELVRGRRELRVELRPRLLTNDSALMTRAAREGLGLAYVSEPAVRQELAAGALELVLPEWAPSVPGLFACFPAAGRKQPKIQAFLAAARAAVDAAGG